MRTRWNANRRIKSWVLATVIMTLLSVGAESSNGQDFLCLGKSSNSCGCQYDWTGCYLGIQGGYASFDPDPAFANLVQEDSSGGAFGGYLGYNQQKNNLVYGLEGDFNFTDLSETVPCFNPAFNCNAGSDWNMSLRGRLGLALDRCMPYVAAGFSFADYEGFTRVVATGATFADSETLTGFTIGTGVEYAWTDSIRLRSEYRYATYGREILTYDLPYLVEPESHAVLFGISVAR